MAEGSTAPPLVPLVLVPTSAVLGIVFALWLWRRVSAISVSPASSVFRSNNGREMPPSCCCECELR